MPRGKSVPKRVIQPDPKYHHELVAKFIHYVMRRGKKTIAEQIVYGAFDRLAKEKQGDAGKLFEQVIDIVRPAVEVRSRRVGGANYQVPMPVPPHRQNALAFRWIIEAAKGRKGHTMEERLAAELIDILNGIGGALKKKEDVVRMAEANRAFAHFARFARGKK